MIDAAARLLGRKGAGDGGRKSEVSRNVAKIRQLLSL